MQAFRFESYGRRSLDVRVPRLIAAALPAVTFLALVGWFRSADVYNRHFFDSGLPVIEYNVVRIAFAAIFLWLVYALGLATLHVAGAARAGSLRAAERATLAFGTGIGVLHVIMLVLGVAGMYYPRLALALCLVALIASGKHFSRVVTECVARARTGWSPTFIANAAVIGLSALWLLAVKGLYPGGGGDYYTHYFYYYMAVLHNHGLAPNDVWYHFYYSKGAGTTFLGMLVTDPEAPEVVTYVSVLFTAIALAALSARLLPKSIWPAFAAALYLLAYIVPLGPADGGEFQKPHEETSALVVFTVWALCMRLIGPLDWRRPCLVMAAAALIGAAISELAAAIIMAAVLTGLAAWSLARRKHADVAAYALLAAVAGGAAVAVMILNFIETGLATDQALDTMLRYANLERLNDWGVIPQLIIVAWIRDNYALVAPRFGFGQVAQLRDYLRLDYLWALIGSAFAALSVRLYRESLRPRFTSVPGAPPRGLWQRLIAVEWISRAQPTEVAALASAAVALLCLGVSIDEVRNTAMVAIPAFLIAGGLLTFAILGLRRALERRRKPELFAGPSDAAKVAAFVGALLGGLALISVPAAGSQTVSYLRFCGFFVPLILIFVAACWGVLCSSRSRPGPSLLLSHWAPISLIVVALGSWQLSNTWFNRALPQTRQAVKFALGRYSLANAYSHQSAGLAYGGIKPAVLQAFRRVPTGERIWSTDVDGYCMVPGCVVESAVSFKMSPRLNEILNGSPVEAKRILQSEHLNYFLFSLDAPNGIIDLLPFSRLFAPRTIGRYLGVKWTDGLEYLLTWRGPGVTPMSRRELKSYATRLASAEHPWFRFRLLTKQMDSTMNRLTAQPHPWRTLDFAWRKAPAKGRR